MPGISERKLVQEQASLAGFRLDDKSVKTLVDWLANGANEEELQQLFNAVDTGVFLSDCSIVATYCLRSAQPSTSMPSASDVAWTVTLIGMCSMCQADQSRSQPSRLRLRSERCKAIRRKGSSFR
jgi:hypothetical protein